MKIEEGRGMKKRLLFIIVYRSVCCVFLSSGEIGTSYSNRECWYGYRWPRHTQTSEGEEKRSLPP